MKLTKYGFIFVAEGMAERAVLDNGSFRAIVVGVNELADALPAAKNLVDEGVQLIELCGEFGPVWTAKVLAAIEQRIPVGSVSFGAESLEGAINLAV